MKKQFDSENANKNTKNTLRTLSVKKHFHSDLKNSTIKTLSLCGLKKTAEKVNFDCFCNTAFRNKNVFVYNRRQIKIITRWVEFFRINLKLRVLN